MIRFFVTRELKMEQEYKCSEGHILKVLTVAKLGPNKGREFIAGDECGAFHWIDNYRGNAPKCTPKKENIQQPKKTPAQTNNEISEILMQFETIQKKAQEIVDFVDTFKTHEEKVEWFLKLANIMNIYFLSKLNKPK